MNKAYPNPENCSADELSSLIRISKNVEEKTRLLAIHMLWEGMDVLTVSKHLCISDVSVYNYIARFNFKGVEGLLKRTRTGRPRLVKTEDFSQLVNVFNEPQEVGKLHWTAKKFHAYLKSELEVNCSYQTVLRYLGQEGYVLKYGRSWPAAEEEHQPERDAFKSVITGLNCDPCVRIWYSDEAGFDGDPRPRRGWSRKGERKKIYRTQKHLRMNVIGMTCPQSGEFFALEVPYTDRQIFQTFLDVANREIISENGKRDIIILDNASWHKSLKIDWGRFEPIFLPPYSPDLNPIERIWAYLKQQFFNSFSAKNMDQLIAQLDSALLHLFDNPDVVNSITAKK